MTFSIQAAVDAARNPNLRLTERTRRPVERTLIPNQRHVRNQLGFRSQLILIDIDDLVLRLLSLLWWT